MVKLYAAGSGLTGTLPALPNSLSYLEISETVTTGFDSIPSDSTLKTLLASDAALAALPSPLPAATLEYAVQWVLDSSGLGWTTSTSHPCTMTASAAFCPIMNFKLNGV